MQVHRKAASEQAVGIGLVDPDGPGSWTHPHLTRMLYADGKVVTPLFKAQAGDTKVDKQTGEIKALPYEPDAEKGSKPGFLHAPPSALVPRGGGRKLCLGW